jgi:hypothetical protein
LRGDAVLIAKAADVVLQIHSVSYGSGLMIRRRKCRLTQVL